MATQRSTSVSRSTTVPCNPTTGTGRVARTARFQDIAGLRAQLPKYWWTEVSRVRALIDADLETGVQAAELFEYVADALADEGEGHDAVALWAASRKLSAIAASRSASA